MLLQNFVLSNSSRIRTLLYYLLRPTLADRHKRLGSYYSAQVSGSYTFMTEAVQPCSELAHDPTHMCVIRDAGVPTAELTVQPLPNIILVSTAMQEGRQLRLDLPEPWEPGKNRLMKPWFHRPSCMSILSAHEACMRGILPGALGIHNVPAMQQSNE